MEYKECNFKTQNYNLSDFYTNAKIKIVNEQCQWRLDQILSLEININKYVPFKGSSYIPLPKHIQDKHAIINVKNKDKQDNKCFVWPLLYTLLKYMQKESQIIKNGKMNMISITLLLTHEITLSKHIIVKSIHCFAPLRF